MFGSERLTGALLNRLTYDEAADGNCATAAKTASLKNSKILGLVAVLITV